MCFSGATETYGITRIAPAIRANRTIDVYSRAEVTCNGRMCVKSCGIKQVKFETLDLASTLAIHVGDGRVSRMLGPDAI